MKYEFCFLEKEKLEKEERNFKRNFEIREILSNLLFELEKIGNKKINRKIEDFAKEYFEKNNIKFESIFYQVLDTKYTGMNEKYYDRALIIRFPEYHGYSSIEILNGYESNCGGGYYNNLLEINKWLDREEINKQKTERELEFENAYKNLDLYNEKLNELIKLRDSFGYLAK